MVQKIVFLGYAVSIESSNFLSGASIAGNKMQVNVLKELDTYKELELHSFSIYPVASFPKDKAFYKKAELPIVGSVKSTGIPFCNLPIIKQLWQIFSMYRCAKQVVDKDTIVLTFNQYPQIGIPSMWLKKKYGCRVYSLLADLPIDDNYNSKNPIRNILRKRFDDSTKKSIKLCNGLIVLNRNAALKYAPNVPYVVMEGGIDADKLISPVSNCNRNKNLIYSGALSHYSGIRELIKAMDYVDDSDAILEIYGDGPLRSEIEQYGKDKSNVRYCGKVSNDEMLKIQREAYLLVNPRPVDDEISKVTFPSKIFEYLASGTPVLSTKLAGLNEDFLSVMFTSGDTSEELAKAISEILKMDWKALNEKATEAYLFVKNEKNWKKQTQRIVSFLME